MEQLFMNTPFIIIIFIFLLSLFILSKSTDYLTDSAIVISKSLGISDIIIGATVVSLGTSLPEFATTISALISGSNDLALGNSLGSIITNTSLILSLGILYGSIPVSKKSASNVVITFLGIIGLYFASLFNNSLIPRVLGYTLLIALPLYLLQSFNNNNSTETIEQNKSLKEKLSFDKLLMLFIKVIISGLIVALSSSFLVATVQVSASRVGISEAIISATVVALGTSLPELSTVISSAKKGYGGLAFGNLVGASLMNLLFVLGTAITFSKTPITVPKSFLIFHFPIAMVIFLYLLFSIYNPKKHVLTKKDGAFLIIIYIIYILYNLLTK